MDRTEQILTALIETLGYDVVWTAHYYDKNTHEELTPENGYIFRPPSHVYSVSRCSLVPNQKKKQE